MSLDNGLLRKSVRTLGARHQVSRGMEAQPAECDSLRKPVVLSLTAVMVHVHARNIFYALRFRIVARTRVWQIFGRPKTSSKILALVSIKQRGSRLPKTAPHAGMIPRAALLGFELCF